MSGDGSLSVTQADRAGFTERETAIYSLGYTAGLKAKDGEAETLRAEISQLRKQVFDLTTPSDQLKAGREEVPVEERGAYAADIRALHNLQLAALRSGDEAEAYRLKMQEMTLRAHLLFGRAKQ